MHYTLPKSCNNNSSISECNIHCRDYFTPEEEYFKKITDLIADYVLNDKVCLEEAVNDDYVGQTKEAQEKYNKVNDLYYFLLLVQLMHTDNKLIKLYSECDTTPCDNKVLPDKILISYKIEQLLDCLKCDGYLYKELKNLLIKLGWKFSVLKTTFTGIGYMCIIDEAIEDFVCDCNYEVFTVK